MPRRSKKQKKDNSKKISRKKSVKEKRYKTLGFYYCRNKLVSFYNFFYLFNVNIHGLIQADDTDFPHFSKSQKGWTLDRIHKWITTENRGLAGTVQISKKKLKYMLDLCSKS